MAVFLDCRCPRARKELITVRGGDAARAARSTGARWVCGSSFLTPYPGGLRGVAGGGSRLRGRALRRRRSRWGSFPPTAQPPCPSHRARAAGERLASPGPALLHGRAAWWLLSEERSEQDLEADAEQRAGTTPPVPPRTPNVCWTINRPHREMGYLHPPGGPRGILTDFPAPPPPTAHHTPPVFPGGPPDSGASLRGSNARRARQVERRGQRPQLSRCAPGRST
jgi:hypothetical protein